MLDSTAIKKYTKEDTDHLTQQTIKSVHDPTNLDNDIAGEITPTMEGEKDMGRQKVIITLPSGEEVLITGSTQAELIQNALLKYGSQQPTEQACTETFGQYTDRIFDVFLKPRWKPSTANTNRNIFDKHILPYFSDIPLVEIDVTMIQRFFQTKQHLSKSYTKQMLIMLHLIFINAIEDKKVKEDPTLSRRITLPTKATKRHALELEQYRDIISHIDLLQHDDAMFLALLCFTGMRRGEILGLKWENVGDNTIHVCSEVIYRTNRPIFCDYAKSRAGIRDIPISSALSPYLEKRGEGLLFGKDQPYSQCKFERMWQRINKTIDLYGATPHVFRHTYLSTLAASDVDPKTIQAIAGHADFSFTFNKYIDKDLGNIKSANTKLEKHLNLTQK